MRRAIFVVSLAMAACTKAPEPERRQPAPSTLSERWVLIDALDEEIRQLDQRIRALSTQEEGDAERERLEERRALLGSDVRAVKDATEADWPALEAKAREDLRGPGRI